MKKGFMNKRVVAMLIVAVMVLTLIPGMGFAATHGNLELSIPMGENIELNYTGGSGTTYNYDVDSTLTGYYPSVFSLRILPDTGVSVATATANNNSLVTATGSDDYYLVTLEEGTTTIITITSSTGGYTYVLSCDAPEGGSTGTGTGIHAYLPAPGQFVNEYMTSGGWGTIYTAGQTEVKDMTDEKVSTGVSLGYFGGYLVLDYGTPSKDASGAVTSGIYNDASNQYGADFILYGNAFKGNSEPGCVQVSKDGTNWYDIAGSIYYNDATESDYSLTYKNPTPGDDTSITYGGGGTIATGGVTYTGSSTGTVTYNPWHQHSWFPLFRNYFTSQIQALGALDKTSTLPFATYTKDTTNGSTLELEGVMLGDATATTTSLYQYGYCDVHPNGSATSTAYSPYTATDNSTGGDPIDISWAVNGNGEPVNLDSIRFVRIYTGAKKMNGMFGPISTEVCGSYRAVGNGSGAASTDLVVKKVRKIIQHSNMSKTDLTVSAGSFNLTIISNEDNVFVNGDAFTGTTYPVTIASNETKNIQIITQSGTESPYVTLIKVIGN
jgi:hypothetical protein